MKRNLTLFSVLFFCITSLTAQQTGYQWAKSAGGDHVAGASSAFNRFDGMVVDREGNTYVSGSVVEGMSFGDSVLHIPYGSFGANDAMMVKYDKCGKMLWYKIYGGKSADFGGYIALPPGENYLLSKLFLVPQSINDSVILHLENKDTVIKTSAAISIKVSTKTGKIIKYWTDLVYPTGANYDMVIGSFMSPNRIVGIAEMDGNYNGEIRTGYQNIIALFDSNLNIIRSQVIDSGQSHYYYNDYGITFPPIEVDKYGNIYNETILQPSNPSSVLHVYDTSFTGLSHGEGIFFQMDTNFIVKRYKKENCLQQVFISADDNLYMTGGMDNSFYYDTTHFYGNSSGVPHTPIYIKIDTSLNLVGYSYPRSTGLLQYQNLIKATTSKVYVGGFGFSDVKWGQDSIHGVANTYEMVIWEFAKDSIRPSKVHQGPGFVINSVAPYYMGADEQGNVRIGGNYQNIMYSLHDTIAALGGSSSPNIFTLDWGLDCGDTTHSLIAPLEPAGLIATATGQHAVQVTWQDMSAYERSFHIYRSPNGLNGWSKIDSVTANTAQYIDVNVQPQTAYWYRVAAWNENGESSVTNIDSALTWSSVGIVETNDNQPYIIIYPNPAADRLYISSTMQDFDLAIMDMAGRSCMTAASTHELDISYLPAGVYSIRITGKEGSVVKQFAKR